MRVADHGYVADLGAFVDFQDLTPTYRYQGYAV